MSRKMLRKGETNFQNPLANQRLLLSVDRHRLHKQTDRHLIYFFLLSKNDILHIHILSLFNIQLQFQSKTKD